MGLWQFGKSTAKPPKRSRRRATAAERLEALKLRQARAAIEADPDLGHQLGLQTLGIAPVDSTERAKRRVEEAMAEAKAKAIEADPELGRRLVEAEIEAAQSGGTPSGPYAQLMQALDFAERIQEKMAPPPAPTEKPRGNLLADVATILQAASPMVDKVLATRALAIRAAAGQLSPQPTAQAHVMPVQPEQQVLPAATAAAVPAATSPGGAAVDRPPSGEQPPAAESAFASPLRPEEPALGSPTDPAWVAQLLSLSGSRAAELFAAACINAYEQDPESGDTIDRVLDLLVGDKPHKEVLDTFRMAEEAKMVSPGWAGIADQLADRESWGYEFRGRLRQIVERWEAEARAAQERQAQAAAGPGAAATDATAEAPAPTQPGANGTATTAAAP